MSKSPWMQELMWVRRDERNVIVEISEKPPKTGEMIPTVPILKQPRKKK